MLTNEHTTERHRDSVLDHQGSWEQVSPSRQRFSNYDSSTNNSRSVDLKVFLPPKFNALHEKLITNRKRSPSPQNSGASSGLSMDHQDSESINGLSQIINLTSESSMERNGISLENNTISSFSNRVTSSRELTNNSSINSARNDSSEVKKLSLWNRSKKPKSTNAHQSHTGFSIGPMIAVKLKKTSAKVHPFPLESSTGYHVVEPTSESKLMGHLKLCYL